MHGCRDEANEDVKVAATLVIGRWLTRAQALDEAVTKRFAVGLKDKDAVKKATLRAYGRVRTPCNMRRAASGSTSYKWWLAAPGSLSAPAASRHLCPLTNLPPRCW